MMPGHVVRACREGVDNLKIAVVSPGRDGYSITFIRAHAELLPGEVAHLYGGALPLWEEDDEALPPRSLHLVASVLASLTRRSSERVLSFLAPRIPQSFRVRGLARFLCAEGFTVALAEHGYTGVAMMEVCRRAGIPLVVHFHGQDAYDTQILARYGADYRQLFEAAGAIVAVSQDMVAQLVRLGASRAKVRLNPYGVDTDLFHPGAGTQREPYLLAVGRFVEKKAPHLTLLAFRDVCEAVPEARLAMGGDGPLLDACRSLAIALRIADRVEFLGPLSQREVARRMRGAACYVQHSVKAPSGDREGTPVAVLEAAASGLPVVATRHAGIAESVIHGETGFLVDEHDVGAMARYIVCVLQDDALARRLGAAGRARILKHYTLAQSIAGLTGILRDAVTWRNHMHSENLAC